MIPDILQSAIDNLLIDREEDEIIVPTFKSGNAILAHFISHEYKVTEYNMKKSMKDNELAEYTDYTMICMIGCLGTIGKNKRYLKALRGLVKRLTEGGVMLFDTTELVKWPSWKTHLKGAELHNLSEDGLNITLARKKQKSLKPKEEAYSISDYDNDTDDADELSQIKQARADGIDFSKPMYNLPKEKESVQDRIKHWEKYRSTHPREYRREREDSSWYM